MSKKKRAVYFINTGQRPRVTKDGRAVTLFVWRAFCRECGEPFEVTTIPPDEAGRVNSKAFERVHCDQHKRRVR